jgi:hypothetical protein
MSNPRAKIEEIPLYLGKPWKVNHLDTPSDWRFDLIDGCGRGLYFRIEGAMFKISGRFLCSHTRPWHKDHQTIGVSIARPAKDIASDIMRRLMPRYLKAYEVAVARFIEEKKRDESLNWIAQSLVEVSGGRLGERGRGSKTVYFQNGIAALWNDENIKLELNNLSPTQAIQIISMIKG